MPLEPFRFIHASHLLLDHQLHGLGPQPEDCRSLFEDATLLAFEKIVDACVERRVDCLLLTGNSFDQQDPGLRGQIALARGLERLDSHGIRVFILAGHKDPWEAWHPGIRFPKNVTWVGRNLDSSWPLTRDGRVIATIIDLDNHGPFLPGDCRSGEGRSARWASGHAAPGTLAGGFSIAMTYGEIDDPAGIASGAAHLGPLPSDPALAVDYVARGGADSRQISPQEGAIVHDSGAPQGLQPAETGARGCTLVDLDATGKLRETFIPTAPVRWERAELTLTTEMQHDDLLHAMHQALAKIQRHASDRVWLVSWTVNAESPIAEVLSPRQLPFLELPGENNLPPVSVRTVSVRLNEEAHAVPYAEDDSLAAEYAGLLEERLGSRGWSPTIGRGETPLHASPWEARLESTVAALDPLQLREDARRLGLQWFAAQEQERS